MKEEARKLRLEGASLGEIASKLNARKSTVYYWIKDIQLPEKIKKDLSKRGNIYSNKKRSEKRLERIRTFGLQKISNNKGTGSYDPKGIGDRSEARVIAELLDAGFNILLPFGDRNRYDMVVDDKGDFIKIQCKTARLLGDRFVFNTESTNWNTGRKTSYVNDVDVFAVFLRENKKVYIFNVKNLPKGGCVVRLDSSNTGNRGKRFAEDHEFNPQKSLRMYT